jgi:hypothetical protein
MRGGAYTTYLVGHADKAITRQMRSKYFGSVVIRYKPGKIPRRLMLMLMNNDCHASQGIKIKIKIFAKQRNPDGWSEERTGYTFMHLIRLVLRACYQTQAPLTVM